jgi:hypothetical protein
MSQNAGMASGFGPIYLDSAYSALNCCVAAVYKSIARADAVQAWHCERYRVGRVNGSPARTAPTHPYPTEPRVDGVTS